MEKESSGEEGGVEKANSLYELVKEHTRLKLLNDKQKQLDKVKLAVQFQETINSCFKVVDDIAKIPVNFCDNAVETDVTDRPYLKIDRNDGQNLKKITANITDFFRNGYDQVNELKFPENLENSISDLHINLQNIKNHNDTCISVAENLSTILQNKSVVEKISCIDDV